MAQKKNKSKKTVAPPQPAPPPPEHLMDDDALMDDLLAQLDSKDEVVRHESATVLQEMKVNEVANDLDNAPKKDRKARFKARQVGSFHKVVAVKRVLKHGYIGEEGGGASGQLRSKRRRSRCAHATAGEGGGGRH